MYVPYFDLVMKLKSEHSKGHMGGTIIKYLPLDLSLGCELSVMKLSPFLSPFAPPLMLSLSL